MLQILTSPRDYARKLGRLKASDVYRGQGVPLGRGQPILFVPPFIGGDFFLRTMSDWARDVMGYAPHTSDIIANVDCPDQTAIRLGERADRIAQDAGMPLTVIGFSLGGAIARFLAMSRRRSRNIEHAIAIGSPLREPLEVDPMIAWVYARMGLLRAIRGQTSTDCSRLCCQCPFRRAGRKRVPARVRFASIYSKTDGVVGWNCSLVDDGENYEVSGSHIGLVVNPQVYEIIAHALASENQCDEQPLAEAVGG